MSRQTVRLRPGDFVRYAQRMIATYHYKRLCVSAVLIGVMLLLSWLLDPLSSPLGFEFVMAHLSWRSVLDDLHIFPAFMAVLASQDPHNPSEIANWLAFLLQWGLVGYGLGMLFFRKTGKPKT